MKKTDYEHVTRISIHQTRSFKAIDPEVIRQLVQMGEDTNSDVLKEISDIFEEETPKRLQLISDLAQELKLVDVAKTAHHLKSSCNGIGAIVMAQICDDLEVKAPTSNLAQLEEQIDSLKSVFLATLEELAEISKK